MSKVTIPKSLRLRVLAEARGLCAYRHSTTAITGARPVLDHIVPRSQGGPTEFDNLCLACHACNEFKAARVFVEDPETGKEVPLFNPRRQNWLDHFCWSPEGTEIEGLTAIGRATVLALNMNHPLIIEARRRWVAVGWHPPLEDLA